MKRDLISSALAIVVLTLVLGVAYPLVDHRHRAGRCARTSPTARRSRSTARSSARSCSRQPFVIKARRQARPAGTSSRAPRRTATTRPGRSSPTAGRTRSRRKAFYRDQLAAYLALERPYDPGLTRRAVPVDAVTTSASGVDPHISQANARIQAHRDRRRARTCRSRSVSKLVDDNTDGRFLGVLGEPGVNVTTLNLALDRSAHDRSISACSRRSCALRPRLARRSSTRASRCATR